MRHAGVVMARAAMAGFAAALPAPGSKSWWQVLQVKETDTLTVIENAYRKLAIERHPDRGGSDAMMAELNTARDQARKAKTK